MVKRSPELDLSFTKNAMNKTFFRGATSMYFGVEPTMSNDFKPKKQDVILKKNIELLEKLYCEDEESG